MIYNLVSVLTKSVYLLVALLVEQEKYLEREPLKRARARTHTHAFKHNEKQNT